MDNHPQYSFIEETSLRGNSETNNIKFIVGVPLPTSINPSLYITIKQGANNRTNITASGGTELDALIKGFSFIVETLENIKNA